AGHRVQGLHPPALEHRGAGEALQVEAADGARRQEGGQDQGQGQETRQPGEQFGFHDAPPGSWRRLMALNREMPKCVSRPSVLRVQEMYGSSQPGLATTWRTERVSFLP